MDPELQEEIFECIAVIVSAGFTPTREKVLETIEDTFYGEEIDLTLIGQEIDRAIAAKREEEKSWDAVTDFDRLRECFTELDERGIVVVHYAGHTQSDGFEDASDRYTQKKEEGIACEGYCFYHSQDVERAIDGDGLCLAFGVFELPENEGVRIGQTIVEALKKQGFSVVWNGTIKTRILIQPFRWQKRLGSKPSYGQEK